MSCMGEIKPNDPTLLTDDDVNYGPFSCCGDEDLVFLRCPKCHHIWVECFECSTWFTDLDDLDIKQACFLTSDDQSLSCPHCDNPFEDRFYLHDENCHKYLPNRAQVVEAGYENLLARPKQVQTMPQRRRRSRRPMQPSAPSAASQFWVLIGAAIGASIWLIGMSIKYLVIGRAFEGLFPLVATALVISAGYWLWTLKKSGQPISLWMMIQTLLAASCLNGLIVLIILHTRGTLEPLVDPEGKFPDWVNFLAVLILIGMMAIFTLPAIKNRLQREFI